MNGTPVVGSSGVTAQSSDGSRVFQDGVVAGVIGAATFASWLVANLLAAATMGGYFRLRHPHMRISP